MANTIYFPLIDALSNPLTGSLTSLRLYSQVGSAYTNPVYAISDGNGTASFNNVVPSLYSFTFTAASQDNPLTYINQGVVSTYLLIPSLTGSYNGWTYQLTGSIESLGLLGSGIPGTAIELRTDISSMLKYITDYLDDWATQNGGKAWYVESIEEELNMGYNSLIGPRVLIEYVGETPWGGEDVANLVGYVRRAFSISIERGKRMGFPRDKDLASGYGPARPYYQLLDEAIDLLRGLYFPTPMVTNPGIYDGVIPGKKGMEEGSVVVQTIINMSWLLQRPRIQSAPPQIIGVGNYVDLDNPGSEPLPNTTPTQ